MAKIEIWSKDVAKGKITLLNDPQHLYLVYTDDQGNKQILRGGPENGDEFGTDELIIVNRPYKSNSLDWNEGTHIGEIIASGNEDEVSEQWEAMWQKGQSINQQKYDYELLTQNSNTVIIEMTKTTELDKKIHSFTRKNQLWAPAKNAPLEHSLIDRTYDLYEAIKEGIEISKESITSFRKELQELDKNPYIWFFIIAKALNWSIQNLLRTRIKQLLEQLSGPIDPLKPIVVIKESKTGRNELFVDQITGDIFDRSGFVNAINSNKYKGYTLASIDGLATPMSKPDKVTSNNLG